MCLIGLAELYYVQKRYKKKAEPFYEQALAISEKASPSNNSVAAQYHNITARCQYMLANLYYSQEYYEKAVALYEKALKPEEAYPYIGQEYYEEAVRLYEQVLAMSEEASGSDHPETAWCLNSLASLYYSRRLYGEALPLYKRALATSEKALGPDHPVTASYRNNTEKCDRSYEVLLLEQRWDKKADEFISQVSDNKFTESLLRTGWWVGKQQIFNPLKQLYIRDDSEK